MYVCMYVCMYNIVYYKYIVLLAIPTVITTTAWSKEKNPPLSAQIGSSYMCVTLQMYVWLFFSRLDYRFFRSAI